MVIDETGAVWTTHSSYPAARRMADFYNHEFAEWIQTMSRLVFPGDVAAVASRIGSSLMPDNAEWVNRFTVKSTSSSKTYVVAQRREDGVWGCSCRGWIHYRHCKHLTDILRRLATIPTLSTAKVEPSSQVEGAVSSNVMDILASARQAHANLGSRK